MVRPMSLASPTAPLFESLGRRSAYLEVAERMRAAIFRDKLALFQRLRNVISRRNSG